MCCLLFAVERCSLRVFVVCCRVLLAAAACRCDVLSFVHSLSWVLFVVVRSCWCLLLFVGCSLVVAVIVLLVWLCSLWLFWLVCGWLLLALLLVVAVCSCLLLVVRCSCWLYRVGYLFWSLLLACVVAGVCGVWLSVVGFRRVLLSVGVYLLFFGLSVCVIVVVRYVLLLVAVVVACVFCAGCDYWFLFLGRCWLSVVCWCVCCSCCCGLLLCCVVCLSSFFVRFC